MGTFWEHLGNLMSSKVGNYLKILARLGGFEPPTDGLEVLNGGDSGTRKDRQGYKEINWLMARPLKRDKPGNIEKRGVIWG
jgi:hypothetical protein